MDTCPSLGLTYLAHRPHTCTRENTLSHKSTKTTLITCPYSECVKRNIDDLHPPGGNLSQFLSSAQSISIPLFRPRAHYLLLCSVSNPSLTLCSIGVFNALPKKKRVFWNRFCSLLLLVVTAEVFEVVVFNNRTNKKINSRKTIPLSRLG